MFKFLMPAILIGTTAAMFFTFTSPLYKEIISLREDVISYDDALKNSKALERERDKLTQKYNSLDPENLGKIQKLLPDNVDNIRLVIEIKHIASPYGMFLKDVKYDTVDKKDSKTSTSTIASTADVTSGGEAGKMTYKDYGIWNLEFSTTGTYTNLLNFIKDLESNLRIVDIVSIGFSSDSVIEKGATSSSFNSYKYDFKIRTYWLKN